MLSYCSKRRKNTESKNPKTVRTKNGVCNSLTFIKEPEASGLLSSLGVSTPLNKIPLLAPLLF